MKRVLTMQDMSCFGKCSLSVALPIISAMGVECVPLPTAILSTHTGGLGEVVFTDLSDSILPTAEHLERLGVPFDVIYIGYLGTKGQIELAERVIKLLKTDDTVVMLDPVMGDHGTLYKRFDMSYVEEMRELVDCADYVLPNLTEAALLAGVPFQGDLLGMPEIERLFDLLKERYKTQFVITGVAADEKTVGAASMHGREKDIYYVTKRHRARLHGTGDIFASVMAGTLAKGRPLQEAVEKSVDFTSAVIKRTIEAGTDERYGVQFESCLSMLEDEE